MSAFGFCFLWWILEPQDPQSCVNTKITIYKCNTSSINPPPLQASLALLFVIIFFCKKNTNTRPIFLAVI